MPGRPEAEEVTIPDDRHLLVELSRLARPERIALPGVELAGQLVLELQDVLVAGPTRPDTGQVDVVGRVEEVAHPRGKGVVRHRVVPPLDQGRPVHDLEGDEEATGL